MQAIWYFLNTSPTMVHGQAIRIIIWQPPSRRLLLFATRGQLCGLEHCELSLVPRRMMRKTIPIRSKIKDGIRLLRARNEDTIIKTNLLYTNPSCYWWCVHIHSECDSVFSCEFVVNWCFPGNLQGPFRMCFWVYLGICKTHSDQL
jgi:hypothetical protein